MAPEIIKPGQEFDFRVEVWSLGIIMAHMLTGKLPFYDSNANSLIKKIVED